jgi:hypothetical protein
VATARPGPSADELEAAGRGVLGDVRDGGIGDAVVDGALNRAGRGLVGVLNGFGDRADAIAHAAVLRGHPGYVNDAFPLYAGLRREDVQSAAAVVLADDRLTALHVVPEPGVEVAA